MRSQAAVFHLLRIVPTNGGDLLQAAGLGWETFKSKEKESEIKRTRKRERAVQIEKYQGTKGGEGAKNKKGRRTERKRGRKEKKKGLMETSKKE